MTVFTAHLATAEAEGFPQPAGANADQVTAIAGAFGRLFEQPMPADYESFLRTSNGYSFDGTVFYGIVDAYADNEFHPGLFDSNERLVHGSESVDTTLRFVGENGHELFALDTADGRWKVVDRLDWQTAGPDHVFATFEALFTHALAPHADLKGTR